jgi:hypothetical protein
MFAVLLLVSVLTAVLLAVRTKNAGTDPWYLQPTIRDSYYNPNKAAVAGIISFLNSLILYGYFIPIALYVSLEIVRVIQAQFIAADIHMYDPITNKAAKVKSAGLNEELGQVDTIFSDKTGTLTCNQMDFFRVSIAGVAYGIGTTEVERAAKQLGLALGGGPSPRDPKDNLLQFSSDRKAELQGSINMMDHNNNYVPDKTLTERKVSTFMVHDCLAAIGFTNYLLKTFNSLCRFLLYVTRLFLMEFQRIRLRCVTGLNRFGRSCQTIWVLLLQANSNNPSCKGNRESKFKPGGASLPTLEGVGILKRSKADVSDSAFPQRAIAATFKRS